MALGKLYLLVEGDDDERLVNIFKPILLRRYNSVILWKYAQEKKSKIKSFVRSIIALKDDFIFLGDINNTPCVTEKKNDIVRKYSSIINNKKIVVVIKEIESWYLAGLSDEIAKKIVKHTFKTTNTITKEQFDNLIPKKYQSRIDFMMEILKFFSFDISKRKNDSFNYFANNFLEISHC